MKILYHHRTLGDGAEGIHIDEMISAFQRLGHEVETLSVAKPEGGGQGDSGVAAIARRLLPDAVAEITRIAMNLPEYALMRRALTRSCPDLVYKRHALYDIATCRAALRVNVPLILEVNALHSLQVVRRFEPLRFVRIAERLERTALRTATFVVAVSTPLKAHIERLAGPDVRVLVLPNGVNLKLFDQSTADGNGVRTTYGLTDRFVIGWTGMLRRWHGLNILLEAARELPDAALLIVGDGPERSELEERAHRLGLGNRLHITGRVPHQEVPNYVAAFDVAVAADDTTGFASPMKVVEYMALARPIVVPRLPNFDDLINDSQSALQFEPGNSSDLASRLRELRESHVLRERLGRAARQAVEERLNWEANARTVLAMLQSGQTSVRRAS